MVLMENRPVTLTTGGRVVVQQRNGVIWGREVFCHLANEEKDKLNSQVIATDGIAVIVNKNNTTDELSSDQVKTIYTGDATTWDEVVK